MKSPRTVDIETLRHLLRYEPETGKLYWLTREGIDRGTAIFNAKYAGTEAFTAVARDRYKVGSIYGRRFYAHRVIWAIVHGEWPYGVIDHVDGDPINNFIGNLRAVTQADNCRNARINCRSITGVSGVRWWERDKKWVVKIGVNHKTIHIGYFEDFSKAVSARKDAERNYGYHRNHGRAAQ